MYRTGRGVSGRRRIPELQRLSCRMCSRRRGEIPENVSAGMAFAHQIGAPGTPTVIIEGWMLPFTPGPDLMQALVREFVAGRNPFASSSFGSP